MGYAEHHVAVKLLLGVFVLAIYTMYGLSQRNGYSEMLVHLIRNGPGYLPGSMTPLLRSYTGIGPVDRFLTLLQCIFANVVDGSAPHLSLLAIYAAGQLTAVISGMVVESQRSFNQGTLISWFVLWGIAIQCLGFGVVMPIYAIVHLSGTARFASVSKHTLGKGLRTLPQAVILGFILPSILAAWPISPILHQQFVALWQFFPVIISAIMFTTQIFLSPPTTKQTRSNLTSTYKFSEFVALWTHRLTMLTLLLIKIKPEYFPSDLVETLTFSDVFLPPLPFSPAKVSLVDGASTFLKYDLLSGFLAAIIWQFSVSDIYLHIDLFLDVTMKGPGYTFTRITEIRDHILFEGVQTDEEKVIKEGFSDLGMDFKFAESMKGIRDRADIDRKGRLNSY